METNNIPINDDTILDIDTFKANRDEIEKRILAIDDIEARKLVYSIFTVLQKYI